MSDEAKNTSADEDEAEVEITMAELLSGVEIEVDLKPGKNRVVVRVVPPRYLFST